MKTGAISFKGVYVVGSVQAHDPKFVQKKSEQIKKAEFMAKKLESNGVDNFVLKYSNKDGRGNSTDTSTTYLLTNDDAKTVKKYDRIKKDFENLYNPDYFQSDIFVDFFDNMCNKIDRQKKSLAEFIATSKTSKD